RDRQSDLMSDAPKRESATLPESLRVLIRYAGSWLMSGFTKNWSLRGNDEPGQLFNERQEADRPPLDRMEHLQ
ncbi:MAG: hypothetical protein Q8R69_22325, partial [Telluria sp.]|nr:hypothetical protein [Telluria sp.]